MMQLREDFQWCGVVEVRYRACFQVMREGDQFMLSVTLPICALGKMMAQADVSVFIDFPFQGLCGIGKE